MVGILITGVIIGLFLRSRSLKRVAKVINKL
jgi:hypothetical protein